MLGRREIRTRWTRLAKGLTVLRCLSFSILPSLLPNTTDETRDFFLGQFFELQRLGAMLDRFVHRLELGERINVGAGPGPTEVSNAT